MSDHYILRKFLYNRWAIESQERPRFVWSGRTWVALGSNVPVRNFATEAEAHAYAKENGLEPAQFDASEKSA